MRIIALLFLSFSVFANGLDELMRQAYVANDRRADLDCYYFNPKGFRLIRKDEQTDLSTGILKRRFTIFSNASEIEMELEVKLNGDGNPFYKVEFAQGIVLSSEINSVKDREFYLSPPRESAFAYEHEISKIFCAVNFAKEEPIRIGERTLHLNVHPHTRYDYLNLTSDRVEGYLANPSYDSHILLEEGNYKGNLVDLKKYLQGRPYSLPKNFYPTGLSQDTVADLVVSPAGHNRYRLGTEGNVKVVYTGGNHNYCIWNNTRNLLYAYLRSDSQASIEIVYDTKSIVAQRKGIIGGLSFPRGLHRKSNLLSSLFKDASVAKSYHKAYLSYFMNDYLFPFKGLFSTLEIDYMAQGHSQRVLLKGQGRRKLKIRFIYE